MNTKYQIIEDNGGNLYLFVFDAMHEAIAIDGIANLEYARPGEYNEVNNGLAADPLAEIAGWDGHMDDPQDVYDQITSYECGWTVVCDNGALHNDAMGAAAQRYFGI